MAVTDPLTCVGPYLLEACLGHGATSSVWRATHRDRGAAPVAIKLAHDSVPSSLAAERLRHEGNILAALRHPHIAALKDAGVSDLGRPYLVLELVEGEPIDVHCRRLRLGVAARLRLCQQALGALAHAHQHLVAHGDIKPGNVLVDQRGQVKLLDFGVARRLTDDPSGRQVREAALTLRYAAPELVDRGELSVASDLYALGVLLYELLGGHHPTLRPGAGEAEQVHALLNKDAPLLSAQVRRAGGQWLDPATLSWERATTPRRLVFQLQGDLDRLLSHLLCKSPDDRYPSAEAVADDIQRHLDHLPLSLRGEAWPETAAKFLQRHRIGVAAGTLAALAAVAGTVGAAREAQTAREQTVLARQEMQRATTRLAQYNATTALVRTILSDSLREPRSPAQTMERAVALAKDVHATEASLRARLLERLAGLQVERGNMADALELAQDAEAAARQVGDTTATALAQCMQATMAITQLDITQARALYKRSLETLRASGHDDRVELARCLSAAGVVESFQGNDIQTGLAFADEAVRTAEAATSSGRQALAAARLVRLDALIEAGHFAEANQLGEALLAALQAAGREQSFAAARLLISVASVNLDAGQKLRAAEFQARAIDIQRRISGEAGVTTVAYNNLGRILTDIGEFEAAEPVFDKALAKAEATRDLTTKAIVQLNLASLRCAQRDRAGCRQVTEDALRVLNPLVPPGHARRANINFVKAMVAKADGDTPRELQLRTEAVQIQIRNKGSADASAVARLALVEVDTGDLESAARHAAQSVNAAQAALAGYSHSEGLGLALFASARLHEAQGNPTRARSDLQQALEHLLPTVGPKALLTREVTEALARTDPR